jgi:hypothetical protein
MIEVAAGRFTPRLAAFFREELIDVAFLAGVPPLAQPMAFVPQGPPVPRAGDQFAQTSSPVSLICVSAWDRQCCHRRAKDRDGRPIQTD